MARDPEANGRAGPEVLAQLAEDVLPTLIARLDRSGLGELEVRQDGWRIRLRRAELTPIDRADAPPTSPRRGDRRPDRPTTDRSTETSADARPHQLRPADRGMVEVTAPAVGYYAARDGLAIGSSVRAGDVIGHVDVLGVRVEVVAPEDGLIGALDAEPGEAVEYGQTVAHLERSRSGAEAKSAVEAPA